MPYIRMRRWLQFRLRSLMLLVLAAALWLGFGGWLRLKATGGGWLWLKATGETRASELLNRLGILPQPPSQGDGRALKLRQEIAHIDASYFVPIKRQRHLIAHRIDLPLAIVSLIC